MTKDLEDALSKAKAHVDRGTYNYEYALIKPTKVEHKDGKVYCYWPDEDTLMITFTQQEWDDDTGDYISIPLREEK